MRRGRLAALASVCAASALIVEGTLRVVALGHGPLASALREWDPETSTLELEGEACFHGRPGTVIRFVNGTSAHVNALGFRGPEVAVPKPPGTFRVVLLGGSTSHGSLVDDDQTIDAHLRRILDVPGATRVEVVNLGFDTLDALCDQERLRQEGLRLEPDAVIVHSGTNDVPALRFAVLAPDAAERGQRVLIRRGEEARRRERGVWRVVKHWSFAARLPGVLRKLLAPPGPVPGPPQPVPASVAAYADTIRRTVELAPPGTIVLLSTPPSGLHAPAATRPRCGAVVDAATTQRYRDALDAAMRRVAHEAAASGRRVVYVPHHVPDAVFLDDCHLDGAGNRALAEDFARALRASVRAAAGSPAP